MSERVSIVPVEKKDRAIELSDAGKRHLALLAQESVQNDIVEAFPEIAKKREKEKKQQRFRDALERVDHELN